MPKLYEYLGLVVMFYANEHMPVHVHGVFQDRESRAELVIVDGRVVAVRCASVRGRRPLNRARLADFRRIVEGRADDIVRKWVDFFVLHKQVEPETIARRPR